MLAKLVWSSCVKMIPNEKHPNRHVAKLRPQLSDNPLGVTDLNRMW